MIMPQKCCREGEETWQICQAVNADDAKESSENESNVVALDVRTSLPLATVLSSNANKQSLVVSEHGERFIFTSTSTHARKMWCGAVRFLSGTFFQHADASWVIYESRIRRVLVVVSTAARKRMSKCSFDNNASEAL
jgi:hypothetical protein